MKINTDPFTRLVAEEDQPHEIPNSWLWVEIGALSEVIGGGTPTSTNSRYFDGGTIPWVTPADMSGYSEMYISEGRRNITEEGLQNSSARLLPKDSLLFSSRAPIGYVAIAKNPITTSQGFKSFPPTEAYLPHYGYWYLRSIKTLAESMASGTTFLELSGLKAAKLPFPLPPLAEQSRIVAKLDEAMQRVEASKARLEKLPGLLKQFRQAVLAAAVSGRLTESWRVENPQGETTDDLITRLLEARKEKYEAALVEARHKKTTKPKKPELVNTSDTSGAELPELPDSWQWVDFATACEKIFDGTHFSPKNYVEGDYKYITAKNIKEKGLDLSNITYITAEDHASIYARADVKRGDVLYIKDGATTGIATVNTLDEEFSLLSSVGVFRTNPEIIIPEYVGYFLNAPNTRQRMLSEVAGIAITRLTLTKLNGSFLALPPFEEQKEIVRQINHYFELADALETRLEQATAMVEQLPQALSAKAFSGQLVAQDPNDEPASVLLERLRNSPAPTKAKRAAKAATSTLQLEFTMPQSLQEILKQNPEGLSPEKLFSMAGFTEVEVDAFYQELASLQPQMEELKPTGDDAKMWPNTSTTLRLKYTSHED